MSESLRMCECLDCGHRAQWVRMHLRDHGGRDCPKCYGEVEEVEPTPREILSEPNLNWIIEKRLDDEFRGRTKGNRRKVP